MDITTTLERRAGPGEPVAPQKVSVIRSGSEAILKYGDPTENSSEGGGELSGGGYLTTEQSVTLSKRVCLAAHSKAANGGIAVLVEDA